MAEVTLTEEDVPGAKLSKPYDRHAVSALRSGGYCVGG